MRRFNLLACLCSLALLTGCARDENVGTEVGRNGAAPETRPVNDAPESVARGEDTQREDGRTASTGEQGSPAPRALAYPTGDKTTSVLLIEANPPEKVMVGREYEYDIKLTNLTSNLMLNGVEVTHELPDSVELIKAQQPTKQGQQASNADKSKQDDKSAENSNQQASSGNDSKSGSGQSQWRVEQLKPGETAVIKVTALGDEQGSFGHCIGVRYEPVLCLATQFVKPELELTKAAPEKADLCQPIVYRYKITNSGTGAAKNLTITDPLPEGFQTEDGKEEAKFNIQSLAAGQSQEFEVRVFAGKAGEFSSRATANGEGELSATSSKPTTEIKAAQLEIAADGPSVQNSGEPATYQVTVTNNGEIKAEQVRLSAELDQNIRLLKTSDPYEEADLGLVWAMGDLDAGQSKKLWIRMVGREEGEMTHKFAASAACARQREAELARAQVSTEIISLPALALLTADAQDPVQVGEQATYDVAVVNEGTAPAKNVNVVAKLPEQMKLANVIGYSEGQAEGNKITFPEVKELAPGESLEWRITADVEKGGNGKLEVQLTSEMLKDAAISQEPTRLIASSSSSGERSTQSQNRSGSSGSDQQPTKRR